MAEQGAPASTPMLRAIVFDMTALAEGREVAIAVVGGVVIAVSRSQYDPRCTDEAEILDGRQAAQRPALFIAPGADPGVPPAPITEMVHGGSAHAAGRSPRRRHLLAQSGLGPRVAASRWGRRSGAAGGSA